MKLFGSFEAVKFIEENLIFITNDGYLYYIYSLDYKHWRKYRNAGDDRITVKNYADVSREELLDALNGKFPEQETDFMRFCLPRELSIFDMMDLFEADYPEIMADREIYQCVDCFLLESHNCSRSYLQIKNLFDSAESKSNAKLLPRIKELCVSIIGRDIFEKKIVIVDGINYSSDFWIMPVKILDGSNTNRSDNIAEMRNYAISIEEDDVLCYLTPFLNKYFDNDLFENINRVEYEWENEDGTIERTTVAGFEWYLTHNYYTYESINSILKDIRDTIDAIKDGKDTEYTKEIKSKVRDFHTDLVIDFYQRFLYRMEYMVYIGAENGYDLISFKGP